jgi:hypothetical protein
MTTDIVQGHSTRDFAWVDYQEGTLLLSKGICGNSSKKLLFVCVTTTISPVRLLRTFILHHIFSQCQLRPNLRCWWCRLHSTCVELPLITLRIVGQFHQLLRGSTSTTYSFLHLRPQLFQRWCPDPRKENRVKSWSLGQAESSDDFSSLAFWSRSLTL